MPAAPLPAHRSRNGARRAGVGSRLAKRVCLTRSLKGRVPSPGAASRRPPGRAADDPAGVRPSSSSGLEQRRRPGHRTDRLEPAGGELLAQRPDAGASQPPVGVEEPLRRADERPVDSSRCRGRWSEATRSGGRPLWARPRTSPSWRSSMSSSASSKPSWSRSTAFRRAMRRVGIGTRRRRPARSSTGRCPGPPGPAAGGAGPARTARRSSMTITVASGTSTPTSITVVPTSTSQLAVPEAAHDVVPLGGLEPAVDHADPQRRRSAGARPRIGASRAVDGLGGVVDRVVRRPASPQGHDHERAVILGRLLGHEVATGRSSSAGSPHARSGSAGGRSGPCAGPRRRGRRGGPGPATCGMGVAVISSTCGAARRARPSKRLAPWPRAGAPRSGAARRPRPAAGRRTGPCSWNRAWVPTNTRPGRGPRSRSAPEPALRARAVPGADAAGQQDHAQAERLQERRPGSPRAGGPAGRWAPGAPPGRPGSATRARAGAATAVLPEPTSPWRSRIIGRPDGEVGADRRDRRRLVGGELDRVANPQAERLGRGPS